MDDTTGTPGGKGGGKAAPRWAMVVLGALGLALLGGAWMWMRSAGDAAAVAEAAAAPIKGPKKKRAAAERDIPAADSTASDSASAPRHWLPMSTGREDRGFNLYVAWDDPHGDALRARARNLSEGYAREPGRLHVARRRSVLVHPAMILPDSEQVAREDLPLERVLPWFTYDPFEEWSVHGPRKAAPFRPSRFRLVRDSLPSAPAAWQLWAHVDPGTVLAYRALAPDPAIGNGYLDRTASALGPVDTVLGREYFEELTGGPVDSILLFSLAGRPWRAAEVHARRQGRAGAWVFLVDPSGPRAVLLAHDFDRRPCPRDKRVRFRAALDVNGDGRREILLGPAPSLLFFEDGEIFNYLQEEPPSCSA